MKPYWKVFMEKLEDEEATNLPCETLLSKYHDWLIEQRAVLIPEVKEELQNLAERMRDTSDSFIFSRRSANETGESILNLLKLHSSSAIKPEVKEDMRKLVEQIDFYKEYIGSVSGYLLVHNQEPSEEKSKEASRLDNQSNVIRTKYGLEKS